MLADHLGGTFSQVYRITRLLPSGGVVQAKNGFIIANFHDALT